MSQFHEFQPENRQPEDLHSQAAQPAEQQTNAASSDVPQTDQTGDKPPQLPPVGTSRQEPRQERLRHVLYGSLEAIDITIKNLHARRYADSGDWCDPIPVPPSAARDTAEPEQWMVIMTKILLIE